MATGEDEMQETRVKITADTSECEASIQRAIALAERFHELWGDAPRPGGIERLTLRDGDRVILSYEGQLSEEMVRRIKAQWDELFPRTEAVVFSDGLRVAGVLQTGCNSS